MLLVPRRLTDGGRCGFDDRCQQRLGAMLRFRDVRGDQQPDRRGAT